MDFRHSLRALRYRNYRLFFFGQSLSIIGNCVVIDHGSSLATLSAHQGELLVKVGDLVTTGHVIGLVGSTGISTG